MRNAFVTAGAALVCGGLAFTGPAQAVAPLPLNGTRHSSFRPKTSKTRKSGTTCVPDIVPPPSAAVGTKRTPKGAAMEHPKGEGEGGNIENQEIWHDLDTGVTPPPAAVGN